MISDFKCGDARHSTVKRTVEIGKVTLEDRKYGIVTASAAIALLSLCGLQVMAAEQGAPHWGYEGPAGPQNWGKLSDNYLECGSGKVQSPVNLEEGLAAEFGEIESAFHDSPLRIINNGHTIQFNAGAGNTTRFGGDEYKLLQLHFHSPSENALYGKRFPMEAHLVHQNARGELAVLAVFMEQGQPNTFVQTLWDHLPTTVNQEAVAQQTLVNPASLLPTSSDYFHFKGSLTTPPCTEGVSWFVLKMPVDVSSSQVDRFVSLVGENARPVQRMNSRSVYSVQGGTFKAASPNTGESNGHVAAQDNHAAAQLGHAAAETGHH